MKKIMIIGNIGKDAETFEYNNKDYIKFIVCVTSGKGDSKTTDWIECCTQQQALWPYLKKGKKVYVEGLPSVSAYINKENKAIAKITIYVNSIELLGSSGSSNANAGNTPKSDDIPF